MFIYIHICYSAASYNSPGSLGDWETPNQYLACPHNDSNKLFIKTFHGRPHRHSGRSVDAPDSSPAGSVTFTSITGASPQISCPSLVVATGAIDNPWRYKIRFNYIIKSASPFRIECWIRYKRASDTLNLYKKRITTGFCNKIYVPGRRHRRAAVYRPSEAAAVECTRQVPVATNWFKFCCSACLVLQIYSLSSTTTFCLFVTE